jgi:uncharacterized protein (UPF0548 family)
MFLLRKPTAREVDEFLDRSRDLPLSYRPIGIAIGPASASSFTIDEHTVELGRGEHTFQQASDALQRWAHFEMPWVQLFPRLASTEPGSVIAVAIAHLGFWSLNGARITYTVQSDHLTRGFAYGTLTNHAEAGEEVFKIAMDARTGVVSYSIRAASRPRAPLARLGYPMTRFFQARFRRDSGAAMVRAAEQPT